MRRWIYLLVGVGIIVLGVLSYGMAWLRVNASDPVVAQCGLRKTDSGYTSRFVDNDAWPVSITCRKPDGTTSTDVLFGWSHVAFLGGLASIFVGLFVYVGRRRRSAPG